MKPDLKDGLVAAGLLALGAGLWLIFPPASLIIVGTAIAALGIIGSIDGHHR